MIPLLAGALAALSVEATIPAETYFVGQEIPLRVRVGPGTENATVQTPRISGAEVYRVETRDDSDREFRFRIVASRPGRLVVPSVRVVAGEEEARASPIVLMIRSVPAAGRNATFLGGVGPLEVEAEAIPSTSRVGQTLEYQLRLKGPGAVGSTGTPRSLGLDETEVRVESLPSRADLAASPPVRTYRWRLRVLRPGPLVVPPRRVATFDPRTGGYQTRASTSLTIEVADVPGLDPAAIEFGPGPDAETPSPWSWPRWIGGAVAIVLAVGLGFVAWRGWSRRSGRDHRRVLRATAARLARELSPDRVPAGPVEVARRVAESLADYLAVAVERPPGALTPEEAHEGFSAATSDPELADWAVGLVERSDWIRFGSPVTADAVGLGRDAAAFFVKLARRRGRRVAFEKPREAPDFTTA